MRFHVIWCVKVMRSFYDRFFQQAISLKQGTVDLQGQVYQVQWSLTKKGKFGGDDPNLGKCHLHNNAQWHQAVESIWNNDAHCTPAVPRLPTPGKKYFGAILQVL